MSFFGNEKWEVCAWVRGKGIIINQMFYYCNQLLYSIYQRNITISCNVCINYSKEVFLLRKIMTELTLIMLQTVQKRRQNKVEVKSRSKCFTLRVKYY